MRTASPAYLALVASLFAIAAASCDDPKKETGPKPEHSAAPDPKAAVSATASAAPAGPRKATIAIPDDSAVLVSGDRVEFAGPDPKGRILTALEGKLVAGENVPVEASRDVKVPHLAVVVSALTAAKASGITIKTPKRDRTTAEIPLALGAKREGCAAVGFIAKDMAINAWHASGGSALRFNKGMAGPDMTRGSEGVRKTMASCDAPNWFVSADDSVTWGLLTDLVVSVSQPEDGGTAPKARDVAILTKTPVPGHKLEAE